VIVSLGDKKMERRHQKELQMIGRISQTKKTIPANQEPRREPIRPNVPVVSRRPTTEQKVAVNP
jgi:hypothetical protein